MKKHFRDIWRQLHRPPPREHELVWTERIGLGCPACGNIVDEMCIMPTISARVCGDCGYREPAGFAAPIQMRSQDDWLKQFPNAEIHSYKSMPRHRLDGRRLNTGGKPMMFEDRLKRRAKTFDDPDIREILQRFNKQRQTIDSYASRIAKLRAQMRQNVDASARQIAALESNRSTRRADQRRTLEHKNEEIATLKGQLTRRGARLVSQDKLIAELEDGINHQAARYAEAWESAPWDPAQPWREAAAAEQKAMNVTANRMLDNMKLAARRRSLPQEYQRAVPPCRHDQTHHHKVICAECDVELVRHTVSA